MMAESDGSASIEELSASLVREYLFRKGLKGTLTKLDEELPRGKESVSNRTSLAKAVHIEKLMKKNKEETSPYRTMIEVIVKFLQTFDARQTRVLSLTDSPNSVKSTTVEAKLEGGVTDPTPLVRSGSGSLAGIKLTTRGTSHSVSEREQTFLNKQNTVQQRTLNPQSHRGKPITTYISPNSNPPTYDEFSSMPPHVGESVPSRSDSWTGVDVSKGLEVEQNTHTNPSRQREAAKLVAVKPRVGRVLSHDGRTGSGVAATSSGKGTRSSGMRIKTKQKLSKNGQVRTMIKGYVATADFNNKSPEQTNTSEEERRRDSSSLAERDVTESGRQLRDILKGDQVRQSPGPSALLSDDHLLFEDLEDTDLSPSLSHVSSPLSHTIPVPHPPGSPIDLSTAKALRELVFGTATGHSFNAEWRRQNFVFCDLPELEFGLVQHKGGPCGVLAGVQAYILKHLLFTGSEAKTLSSLRPTQKERNSSLVAALMDILWKAGKKTSATVTLPSGGSCHSGHGRSVYSNQHYRPDSLTEKLTVHKFDDLMRLRDFIGSQLHLFQDNSSSGCSCFLYSLILSRGIENVRSDMDSQTTLLGSHAYCSQEIVNLILTGYAVSNVFNNTQELGVEGKDKIILRGPCERSELGFLSLFEYYGSCCVGSHLKNPVFPIWVISAESHFTVLFSHQRQLELDRKFDLHYYDGLANQDQAITLTIDNSDEDRLSAAVSGTTNSVDLIPPLELVIQTKWKSAKVDWNNTEPLL